MILDQNNPLAASQPNERIEVKPVNAFGGIAGRSCSICGKELTDQASVEYGIGPICRNRANDVIAKVIPTQVSHSDFLAYIGIGERLPEPTRSTWSTIETTYLAQFQKEAEEQFIGFDFRKMVGKIVWMLSFSMTIGMRENLIRLIEAFGYKGYASLLRGEASVGDSIVFLKDNRLFIDGPNNPTAREKLKKIKGVKYHPSENKSWSVPVWEVEAFFLIMEVHFPFAKNMEGVKAEALELKKQNVATPTPEVVELPYEFIGEENPWVKLKLKYNAQAIEALKTNIPWRDRQWVVAEKRWEIRKEHVQTVKNLFARIRF